MMHGQSFTRIGSIRDSWYRGTHSQLAAHEWILATELIQIVGCRHWTPRCFWGVAMNLHAVPPASYWFDAPVRVQYKNAIDCDLLCFLLLHLDLVFLQTPILIRFSCYNPSRPFCLVQSAACPTIHYSCFYSNSSMFLAAKVISRPDSAGTGHDT